MSTPDPYGALGPGPHGDRDRDQDQAPQDRGQYRDGPSGRPAPGGGSSGYGYGPSGSPAPGGGSYGDPYGYRPSGYPQHGGAPYGYPAGGAYGGPAAYPVGTQPGVAVGFVDAIKRFYAKYAQFSGRASRPEYWWATLYLFLVNVVLSILIAAGTGPSGELNAFGALFDGLSVLFALAHLVPSLAISVRRLHDVDLSGWFVLLALVPFVGWIALIVLLVLPPKPGGARFDR